MKLVVSPTSLLTDGDNNCHNNNSNFNWIMLNTEVHKDLRYNQFGDRETCGSTNFDAQIFPRFAFEK